MAHRLFRNTESRRTAGGVIFYFHNFNKKIMTSTDVTRAVYSK